MTSWWSASTNSTKAGGLLMMLQSDAAKHGIQPGVTKLPEVEKRFMLLSRRWVVERGFAWVARFPDLAEHRCKLQAPGGAKRPNSESRSNKSHNGCSLCFAVATSAINTLGKGSQTMRTCLRPSYSIGVLSATVRRQRP